MEMIFLSYIVVLVLALVLSILIFKRFFKILFVFFLVFTLLTAGLIYLIYKDAMVFTNAVSDPTIEKLFILKDGTNYIVGVSIKDFNSLGSIEDINTLSPELLKSYRSKGFTNVSSPVFVVDKSVLASVKEVSLGNGPSIQVSKIIPLFDSPTANIEVARLSGSLPSAMDDGIASSVLESQGFTNDKAKGAAFLIILGSMGKDNMLLLFDSFKAGQIQVYPASLFISTIKLIPSSVVEKLMEKGVN